MRHDSIRCATHDARYRSLYTQIDINAESMVYVAFPAPRPILKHVLYAGVTSDYDANLSIQS